MKYLNVAQNYNAAKNIALQLSSDNFRQREGDSTYNQIYEFDAEVNGQECKMVMTSVSGHLMDITFNTDLNNWKSHDPQQLFDAPLRKYYKNTKKCQNIKNTLEREIQDCQGLIIWTNYDREGENIGFEIIQMCTEVKNNLTIFRAKFFEITAVSVWRALKNLEKPNKAISDAVDVRRELDLRIGAAFTRFQTLRVEKLGYRLKAPVSYGSCQFPTLGFVVERSKAVENFVSETFWTIIVIHTINNLSVKFSWKAERQINKDECQVVRNICLKNPQAKVCQVDNKSKSKWRPLPLNTMELQKLASIKLKINAKETMRLAENLYVKGFISYPRTETNVFPEDMNLSELVREQTKDQNWGAFAQNILNTGEPMPRQGDISHNGHPPIYPTKYTNDLPYGEQRLFELIVRSFLACCSKDAQGQETTVTIDVANEQFSASGLVITEQNYISVYPYDDWSPKDIHVYENGQTFNPDSIDLLKEQTSPPDLLTEADLLDLMKEHGIGTDTTYTDHIDTIKGRSYVNLLDDIHFEPNTLGAGLVEAYDSMGLMLSKPQLKAQLEVELKAISEGKKQSNEVLNEQLAKYKEMYKTAVKKVSEFDAAVRKHFRKRTRTAEDEEPVQKKKKIGDDKETQTDQQATTSSAADIESNYDSDGDFFRS